MAKVKTFATPLKVFHARKELEDLDSMVNQIHREKQCETGTLGQRRLHHRRYGRHHGCYPCTRL